MFQKIQDWLEERIHHRELVERHLTGYRVPSNLSFWYSMGAVLLALLLIQFLTGILLLVYYIPHVEKAFDSVMAITFDIPFGWYIRRIHATASNLSVIVLILHLLSTLILGSYKKPRELQWMSGCILFLLVLGASLSGYLLPWSQLAYWATTVATNSTGAIPAFGDAIVHWMRGGEKVGQETLGRFFAIHISVIPLLLLLIVGLHLFFMRRTGISAPPLRQAQGRIPRQGEEEKIPFVPHFALEDLKVIYIFFALLTFFTFILPQISIPEDAWEPANPLLTPPHIKPEWYFLASYQFLKLVPNEFLGIFSQILFGLFLFLLPFIDRNPERHPANRKVFLTIVILGILAYISLTIWGRLS